MARVESRSISRTVPLTAELMPFLQTDIEARVPGYVENVLVDRGSRVRRGQLLIVLSAPEMSSQTSASEAALHQAEADAAQAKATDAAAASTYERMLEASKTPGAVAGNELIQAQKQKEAADAAATSREAAVKAAASQLNSTKEMQAYLRVAAPFDGVITERLVHPGMMVSSGNQQPLLRLQQTSHLRLVVPVPETYAGNVPRGKKVSFHVPASPGKNYSGTIARSPNSLDPQSRSMMVELDVQNSDGSLSPGMYPTVDWPVSSGDNQLFVPATSVVTTTERTFVITSVNGRAHWVNVRKGTASGELVAVRGDLKADDAVVKQATDEIREGSSLR
ncbi:efflux RND transporter periplasmic adaptor subunit [Edaphobacter aggregans]|uniref:efflux RND transporter periplasmic adaptor subunit n=1 Tax=Edaphobacter aggregans TaxID=570835 RepID=UPI0024805480|nr:efflux RND transporter periplasmic adaptor subunit [Edaphobacter aggregans]